MDDNYASAWELIADQLGERTAVVHGQRRLSWGDLDRRAACLATALAAVGVGPGANVGLFTWNCPEYLEATYAAFKLGATPVNINFRYGPQELAYLIEYADVKALVFHASLGPVVASAVTWLPKLPALVQVDDASPPVTGAAGYEDVVASCVPRPRGRRSGQDVFMVCTGGTTGRPKAVVWHHRDLAGWLAFPTYEAAGLSMPPDAAGAARLAVHARASGISPVTLPACPLVHGTAFFFSLAALVLGGSVVLLADRSMSPDEIWSTAVAEAVTQLVVVGDVVARPAVAALERAASAGHAYDLSSLVRVFSSGLVWSAEVKEGLARHCRATMVDMLGSSEGGPFAIDTVGPGDTSQTGRFRLTERAAVLRADGRPAGVGESGYLAISAPIPIGYHKHPAETAATFPVHDGRRYAIPGDMARLEADARVVLLGRGSTCINTGGEKVYPHEVEEALRAIPAVADCLVVGVPDDHWGEVVTAVAALVPGAAAGPGDLIDTVRAKLAGYKVPKRVVLVPHVRRGAAGKPDYQWARAVAIGRLSRDPSPSS